MNLLLDTHVFLWLVTSDDQLVENTRGLIANPVNDVFLSVVSLWEITIKFQSGKLALPHPPDTYIPNLRETHDIRSLPVDEACVRRLASLPTIHKDPFDRMLVCQALELGLTLVTDDIVVRSYPGSYI